MNKIAVIGAGSWGTALAQIIAENGYYTNFWVRNTKLAEIISISRINDKYLPQLSLHKNITVTSDLKTALQDATVVFLVVPTHGMRSLCQQIALLDNCTNKIIVSCSKGFEINTNKRMSEIIYEYLPNTKVTVLSGPNHAEEIALQKPAATVIAARELASAELVQQVLMNTYFRPYTSEDIIGVELAGSVKNIIALAGGMVAGLKLGDNCQSALMTRGLAEMARLGIKLGASPQTFFGLAGMGDLIATCTSPHSRNRSAGLAFATGKTLDEIVSNKTGMVVEGINATKVAYELSININVEMPITTGVFNIIFKNHLLKEELATLMNRSSKKEYLF